MEGSWQIEELIKRAFKRTKERLLSYFLAFVVSFGIGIAALVAVILIGALLLLIYTTTNSVILGIILSVLFCITFIIGIWYIAAWSQLALLQIVIQEKSLGVIETFKKVRPLVWRYLWLWILISLFIVGLLPFGLLSLGIVLILWGFWSSFSAIVFLEKNKSGLENLWYSRALINQRFWGILGRMALVQLALFFINFSLTGSNNRVLYWTAVMLSFISSIFVTSFSYEIYKNLSEPSVVKIPKVWIVLSIIGGITILVLLVLSFSTINDLIESLRNIPPQKLFPIPTLPAGGIKTT